MHDDKTECHLLLIFQQHNVEKTVFPCSWRSRDSHSKSSTIRRTSLHRPVKSFFQWYFFNVQISQKFVCRQIDSKLGFFCHSLQMLASNVQLTKFWRFFTFHGTLPLDCAAHTLNMGTKRSTGTSAIYIQKSGDILPAFT